MNNTEDWLKRNIPVPLYYQIAQLLRQRIESGELKPGDQIPTENELQGLLDVSRATIRRAISDLVYEGLLERRRAKGTIVSRAKLEETLYGMGSFTSEIFKRNQILESKILEFQLVPAAAKTLQLLELEPGSELAYMKRLRIVNGDPVCVEDWYAPIKHFPGLSRTFFKETGKEQSTYYMLREHYGIQLVRAVDSMSAVALEKEDAELLKMDKGMPALVRTRVTYTTTGLPVIYASGRYIIKLVIGFNRGNVHV